MSQGINVERESAARSTLTRTDWVTGPLAQARVFQYKKLERERTASVQTLRTVCMCIYIYIYTDVYVFGYLYMITCICLFK